MDKSKKVAPVHRALIDAIRRILETDFGDKTFTRLRDHWRKNGLGGDANERGSSIDRFLRGAGHVKMLEFADCTAEYFEDLAKKKPLQRKGDPYGMRLNRAMDEAAMEQYNATLATIPRVRDRRLTYNGVPADCIRLVGADDEFFECTDIVTIFANESRYAVPPEVKESYNERLDNLKANALERGVCFESGDIIRLKSFRYECRAADENKTIILELEPLSWFDFSVTIDYMRECRIRGRHDVLATLIDPVDVGAGKMHRTRLPNPLPSSVVLVSQDQHLLYCTRDAVSTQAGLLGASVSENINIAKDIDADGVIQVFRTAERGIGEELSKSLIGKVALSLLGMSFNLDDMECSLLFLAKVAATKMEIQAMLANHHGKDHTEAIPHWVSISDEAALTVLLARKDWAGDGIAAVMLTCLHFFEPFIPGKWLVVDEVRGTGVVA